MKYSTLLLAAIIILVGCKPAMSPDYTASDMAADGASIAPLENIKDTTQSSFVAEGNLTTYTSQNGLFSFSYTTNDALEVSLEHENAITIAAETLDGHPGMSPGYHVLCSENVPENVTYIDKYADGEGVYRSEKLEDTNPETYVYEVLYKPRGESREYGGKFYYGYADGTYCTISSHGIYQENDIDSILRIYDDPIFQEILLSFRYTEENRTQQPWKTRVIGQTYFHEKHNFRATVPNGWEESDSGRAISASFTDNENYAEGHPGINAISVDFDFVGGVGLQGFLIHEEKNISISGHDYIYTVYEGDPAHLPEIPDDSRSYHEGVRIIVVTPNPETETIAYPQFQYGGGKDKSHHLDAFLESVSF